MNFNDDRQQTDDANDGRTTTLGRVSRLIRKELVEILRDRRTVLTLVLMPLLLYPLLSVSFQQFFIASTLGASKSDAVRMGFRTEEEQKDFLNLLQNVVAIPRDKIEDLPKLESIEVAIEPELELLRQKLLQRRIDLIAVPVADTPRIRGHRLAQWKLHYLKNSTRSTKAFHQIGERLAIVNTSYLLSQPPQLLNLPFDPQTGEMTRIIWSTGKAHSLPRETMEFPIGSLVPLILILMTITGAVYPAIDLTAGERERGTLEILVAAPVPRLGLLFAKYVTVVTVAILTAMVNLTMMTVTVSVSGLSEMLFGDRGLSAMLVLQILGLLILFAAFFSAVLLTITSFARSFKEAQAYLIPLMLVSLAPGVAGMIPGIELSPLLCLIPLLNIVLLGRDLFAGVVQPLHVGIVVASTLTYAVIAIALAARIFGAEDVLYNDQSSWAEMFRRPQHPRPAPSVPNALLCMCLMFSIYFVLHGLIQRYVGLGRIELERIFVQLLLLMLLSVVLFVGLPLLSAGWRRVQIRSGFQLRGASLFSFAGALLLGLSLWPMVLQLLAGFETLGWTTMNEEHRHLIMRMNRRIQATMPLWLLVAATVVPAMAEELFFRGFLFSALRKVSGPVTTILVAALLFGIFHVAVAEAFGLERLIPSTLMGIVLGWVCWRSGSVLPPLVLHAAHNTALVLVGYWQSLQDVDATGEMVFLPLPWLGYGAVGIVAGIILVAFGSRKNKVAATVVNSPVGDDAGRVEHGEIVFIDERE